LSASNHASLPLFLLRFGRTQGVDLPVCDTAATVRPDDEALLLQVQSGDRGALELLFLLRYSRSVLSVGCRILRDRAEAEDLVHDVFLLCSTSARSLIPPRARRGPGLPGWLTTGHWDRRKYLVRRYFYDAGDGEEFIPGVEDLWQENGPESVEFCYWQSYLQRALATLTDDQRKTLELHFFQGLTINEISELTGQSAVNVRHHYYRGLERLRSQMFPITEYERALSRLRSPSHLFAENIWLRKRSSPR